MDTLYSDFAYDDAFRTMVVICDELLIPFVNYMFGENYGEKARIVRGNNEHFSNQQDGSQTKRITDAAFAIEENSISKSYHLECESQDDTDGTILVRMFEYDAQIALENGKLDEHTLNVYFPHAGILFLRNANSDSDDMKVVIHTPEGDISYSIKAMNESDFDLEKIYDNGLYFLLPFYAFNYEKEFLAIENDIERQEEFLEMYREMSDKLEVIVDEGKLSAYQKNVIIMLINKVSYKLLMKYQNTQKKVGDLMGGRVLELDIIKAHDEGVNEGREVGRDEGLVISIKNLMDSLKCSAEQAMEKLKIPKSEYNKYMMML